MLLLGSLPAKRSVSFCAPQTVPLQCWLGHSVPQALVAVPLEIHWAITLQGLTVSAIGNELVLYGGDKSGLLVCNTADTDWKWVAPSVQGRCVHICLTRSTCHLQPT